MQVVLLDRDGVINHLGVGYITNPDDIVLLPGAATAIKMLNDKQIPVIVVTNQSIVGRNLASHRQLRKLHDRIDDLLHQESGAIIDRYLYATGIDNTDFNRKPNIGMFKQAKMIYPVINETISWMVGDNKSDIIFGQRSGLKTILIKTGLGINFVDQCTPDYVADDILSAIHIIEKAE